MNLRYFAMMEGERVGPFTLNELADAGVGPETYVWCKGMPDWQRADEVADICRFWRQRLAGLKNPPVISETSPKESNDEEDSVHPGIGRYTILGPEQDKLNESRPEAYNTKPPSAMLFAVLVTLFCFPLTGFVAIYYFWLSSTEWQKSTQSTGKDAENLRASSWGHNRQGKMWTGITFFLGIILAAFMFRFSI